MYNVFTCPIFLFVSKISFLSSAPTQSPSYADQTGAGAGAGNINLPLSMDPVLAVVTNSTGQQVNISVSWSVSFIVLLFQARRHLGDDFSQKIKMRSNTFVATVDSRYVRNFVEQSKIISIKNILDL